MGTNHFSDDFKRDAVAQITERGYPVAEISERLGVSTHSLYAWKKKFSKSPDPVEGDQAAEIRRLKQAGGGKKNLRSSATTNAACRPHGNPENHSKTSTTNTP